MARPLDKRYIMTGRDIKNKFVPRSKYEQDMREMEAKFSQLKLVNTQYAFKLGIKIPEQNSLAYITELPITSEEISGARRVAYPAFRGWEIVDRVVALRLIKVLPAWCRVRYVGDEGADINTATLTFDENRGFLVDGNDYYSILKTDNSSIGIYNTVCILWNRQMARYCKIIDYETNPQPKRPRRLPGFVKTAKLCKPQIAGVRMTTGK